MSNTILIKRKTTTGAPALGDLLIGEMCLVLPDKKLYQKVDASTLVVINNNPDIIVGTSATPPSIGSVEEGTIYFQREA